MTTNTTTQAPATPTQAPAPVEGSVTVPRYCLEWAVRLAEQRVAGGGRMTRPVCRSHMDLLPVPNQIGPTVTIRAGLFRCGERHDGGAA